MTAHPSNCRILVADDDPPLRQLIVTALKRARHPQVVGVTNGAEAIEKLRSERWSALILDLMMPKMSGWDVLSWLDQNQKCLPGSVIVASAASREILRELDPRVVNAIIFKPFDVFQMTAYVGAACQLPARDRRKKRMVPEIAPGSGAR